MLMRDPGLRWIFRPDGAFVYNDRTGAVKVLNETGAFIAQRCEKNVFQITNELVESFEVGDRKAAALDVERFLKQMVEEGYLCKKE